MPAHCGDPVSSALQHSLLSQKRLKDSSAVSFNLITNAKQILESHIKYDTVFTSSIQPLDKLKAQYSVLSTLGATSSSHSSSSSASSTSTCQSGKPSPVPSSSSQHGNRTQADKRPPTNAVNIPVPKRTLFPSDAVVVGWNGNSVPIGSGFLNLGNTCYLNSTLQALFHVPAFVNWLLSDKGHFTTCERMNGSTHSECLICAMAETLAMSHRSTGSAIKPSKIHSKLQLICKHLNPGQQEDAHEFLRYLLEGMERSYLSIFNGHKLDNLSKETTPLGQIFGGYIRTEVTCLECKHISTTFQHFQDLILDIRTASSVEEALENYFARERLGDDGDHPYKCEQCKRRVAATKKFSLERPPKSLCVQMKRFGVLGGKNNKHINIKQILDMTKFRHRPSVGSQLSYKLVSMVNHLGNSSNCGHYTAVGLTSTGAYYLFDDTSVRQTSLSSVLSTSPYILMYELDSPPQTAKTAEKFSAVNAVKVDPVLTNGTSNGTTNGTLHKHQENSKSPHTKSTYGRLKSNLVLETSHSSPIPSGSASTPSTSSQVSLSSSSSTSSPLSRPKSPLRNGSVPVSTSPSKPSTSNTPQKTKPFSSEGPSLVPYLSRESSDSESESPSPKLPSSAAASTSSHDYQPTTNGWAKDEKLDRNCSSSEGPSTSSAAGDSDKRNGEFNGRSQVSGPLKVEVDKNGSSSRGELSSPAGSVSSGKWSVTSCDREESSVKSRDSGANQSTIQSLLRMSHQGYGHSGGINDWNGNCSNIDIDVARDREANKRPRSPYDEFEDRGKVKKAKYNCMNQERNRNRFQDYTNRKMNWAPRPPRREFYKNYVFTASNNHNNKFNKSKRWH